MRRGPSHGSCPCPVMRHKRLELWPGHLPNCPEMQEAEGVAQNGQTIETVCVRITGGGLRAIEG
jgi:hypothetical protein